MDRIRILTDDEIKVVLTDLKQRSKRTSSGMLNLVIFRLSCCCGLRSKEIRGLKLSDVVTDGPRPYVLVRKDNTKGRHDKRKARKVPLWWSDSTLADLKAWVELRKSENAKPTDIFIRTLRTDREFSRDALRARWESCLRVLGDRKNQLSIHTGRHSFCSHTLRSGRSIVEVRDAAGHSSISTTSIYLHSLETDAPKVFD